MGRRLANEAKGAGLAGAVKFGEVSGSTNAVQAVKQIYKARVDAS